MSVFGPILSSWPTSPMLRHLEASQLWWKVMGSEAMLHYLSGPAVVVVLTDVCVVVVGCSGAGADRCLCDLPLFITLVRLPTAVNSSPESMAVNRHSSCVFVPPFECDASFDPLQCCTTSGLPSPLPRFALFG